MSETKKLKPRCFPGNKQRMGIAYCSNGWLLPCCWLDNLRNQNELADIGLFDESLKLENNKDVASIVNSHQWRKFIENLELVSDKVPSRCWEKCGEE